MFVYLILMCENQTYMNNWIYTYNHTIIQSYIHTTYATINKYIYNYILYNYIHIYILWVYEYYACTNSQTIKHKQKTTIKWNNNLQIINIKNSNYQTEQRNKKSKTWEKQNM